MYGAIPPLPNTPSWRGVQLIRSTGTTLTLLSIPLNSTQSFKISCKRNVHCYFLEEVKRFRCQRQEMHTEFWQR